MKYEIDELKAKRVFIIGNKNVQNEFLEYLINKEIKIRCSLHKNIHDMPDYKPLSLLNPSKKNKASMLVLIDSSNYSFEEILKDIVTHQESVQVESLVALFNLTPGTGVEKTALSKNIRGFFYKDEYIELLLKGIRCIFKGETWISRDILLHCVLDGFERRRTAIKKHTTLTQREIEILALVSMGAKNEDIANKMFISPNTVKTHLYNIFKKIKVPNRLQAALWVTRNL